MISAHRALAVGLVVCAASGVTGCTTGTGTGAEDALDSTTTSGVAASGTSPIVFAFVCRVGSSDRTETYTTYSAVWEDERTDCDAERITGTQMSSQQRAAVEAAEGDATIEELAAACAVRDAAPWARPVTTSADAHLAAGVLQYCPGHPETRRLRDTMAAWRS